MCSFSFVSTTCWHCTATTYPAYWHGAGTTILLVLFLLHWVLVLLVVLSWAV